MDKIDEILHTAPSRIQQHRTAEAVIQLKDPAGFPIPKSKVTIRLIQHSFLFGSNAFGLYAGSNPEYQRAYEERFSSLLNYATLPFYWGGYESRMGVTQAERLMKMAEWCQDHNKALETHPFGAVGSGGPVTLPDPNILTNGNWYGGSPYLGPDATARAVGATPIPPAGTVGNSPTGEAGYAFMWHSHNEREITTNNAFPGGMMMMMLVDPQAFTINEAN